MTWYGNEEGIMEKMVGSKVAKVQLLDGGYIIRLFTDRGIFEGVVEGDCCSSTWIENVEYPAFGYPFEIAEVDHKWLPDNIPEEDEDNYEVIAYYGISFRGTRGDSLNIDFRNSSNGYYGGSLEWRTKNADAEATS